MNQKVFALLKQHKGSADRIFRRVEAWLTTGVAIYTGPGTVKAGKVLGKGAYTIVEVRGDYSRLKSGFGWVQMGDVIRI